MKWNTEPLYDDDGTDWNDKHPDHNRIDKQYEQPLFDTLRDGVFYVLAVLAWLGLLFVHHGVPV